MMRLWSDEIEAMRAEAREVVAGGSQFMAVDASASAGLSRDEQVALARAGIDANTYPVPEAEERTIGGVACRVHRPAGDARAVYLHFHGGGMISGSASLMDIPNQMLAGEHNVAIVSVEYRKAPEFPWPAGPDDGAAVARALLDGVAAELGSERLLIGGESAGGYMAAAVALRVREMGAIDRVDGLNLTYGVHDWGGNPSQHGVRVTEGPDVLSPAFMELARRMLRPRHDLRRAPGPRSLTVLRRPARHAAMLRGGGYVRPSLRRFPHVRHPRGRGRRRCRLLRAARDAAHVPGVRLRDHTSVGPSASRSGSPPASPDRTVFAENRAQDAIRSRNAV